MRERVRWDRKRQTDRQTYRQLQRHTQKDRHTDKKDQKTDKRTDSGDNRDMEGKNVNLAKYNHTKYNRMSEKPPEVRCPALTIESQ